MIREATNADIPLIESIIGIDPRAIMQKCTTLIGEYGGVFIEPFTPSHSVVEAHIFFDKNGRGRKAIAFCRAAVKWCWENGIYIIIGRVPLDDRPAKMMARWAGMVFVGTAPREPNDVIVDWFELRRDQCSHQR